jgi:predicted membrane protein
MEKFEQKLKTSSVITLILGILSATWLFLDYLALKEIWLDKTASHNFEWIIVMASAIPFVAFHISAFFTIFYSFRFRGKYRSEKRKQQKNQLTEEEKSEDIKQT